MSSHGAVRGRFSPTLLGVVQHRLMEAKMSITHLLDTNVIEPLVTEALTFGDCTVRQPDFIDEVTGTAVWMAEDGCVEVAFERLVDVARLARDWMPRGRQAPETFGIVVALHNPHFVHPAFRGYAHEAAHAMTAWAEFSEILRAAA